MGLARQEPHSERGDVFEILRNDGQRWGIPLHLVLEDLQEGTLERALSDEGLVEHGPHGVPVAGGRHRHPGRLLGGHVARRPRDLVDALHQPGLLQLDHQAEIEQDDPAVGRDHHVGGLEVAVDDVVAVQGHHAHRQLRDRRAQPRLVEPAAGSDVLEEVDTLEQVHREEPLRAVGLEAMQADQVRVADIGGRAELALEAVESGPVDVRQQLERDAITPHEVHRLEHDPHAAAPQLADQPVVAQPARRQRLVVHRLAGCAASPGCLDDDVDSRNTWRISPAWRGKWPMYSSAVGVSPASRRRRTSCSSRLRSSVSCDASATRSRYDGISGRPRSVPALREALADRGDLLKGQARAQLQPVRFGRRLDHRTQPRSDPRRPYASSSSPSPAFYHATSPPRGCPVTMAWTLSS